jgi:hypothetical protein
MKINKLRGDSPLKLIFITLLIIFFIALFAWQIEKYLAASQDSKLQGQISRIHQLIEADSLDDFSTHKYAYLHSDENISEPLEIEDKKLNFEPQLTLSTLFVQSRLNAASPPKGQCYIYLYFPPGEAKYIFDFYEERDPAYVLAGWSKFRQQPIVGASPGLTDWAESNLKESDFACDASQLSPDSLAVDKEGVLLDLPGMNFQFSDQYYSKVKL